MSRFFCSLWLGLALFAPGALRGDPLPLEVRQVVIRAPEMEVVGLALDPAVSDARLSESLWRLVREGRARLISDLTSAAEDGQFLTLGAGRRIWLPTELDQDFDRLYMTPTACQEFPVGVSLKCQPKLVTQRAGFGGPLRASWSTFFSPRGPVTVQWPSSWLRVVDADRPSDKVIHGWLDWRDQFEETISAHLSFQTGSPTLAGILPPADQLWPGQEKARWLDVFLAQMGPAGAAPTPDAAPGPIMRTVLLGIALDNIRALTFMSTRKPDQDAELLQTLLAKVEEGSARLVLSVASGADQLNTRMLASARMHDYPTEMPSIPSAWDARPVGTRWEGDSGRLALSQDLAPPARTEWKLAQDVPEAIMWQPRFRELQIDTVHPLTSGTRLLGVSRIPEVMRGPGLSADETVFVFASHRSNLRIANAAATPVPSDPFAPVPGGESTINPVDHFEAEMLVFEVPAKEEAKWQPVVSGLVQGNNRDRLQALLDRAHSGAVPVVAHHLLHLSPGGRSALAVTEEYPTATEFDPPGTRGSPRMRPTALMTLPVGSRWQIHLGPVEPGAANITFSHIFEYSTARPVEPPLAETLAIAARDSSDYPGAIHHFETWKATVTPQFNEPLCLGTQDPPGDDREVRHVAFLRVRKLPAQTP
ncbi:MAG TPA: hypothetical protein VD994_18500 [Prosthecobacter sp.]|nr:hypothetical protein [Prosthecobacter sp.]